MAYALTGANWKQVSLNLLVCCGFIATLPWSTRKDQCMQFFLLFYFHPHRVLYFKCHSRWCWSPEELCVPSSGGRSRAPYWCAGSGSSRRGGGDRRLVYRQHRSNARGSGTGRTASWRECTRTRAPAHTAPSSGECLQCQCKQGESPVFMFEILATLNLRIFCKQTLKKKKN